MYAQRSLGSCHGVALTIWSGACPQFALNGGRPVGASIPATEHSVMTAWLSERQAIENMIDRFGTGFFACVMDSYDYAEVRAADASLTRVQGAFAGPRPLRTSS